MAKLKTRRIVAGMTITVYEDPITRKKPEGRALLIKRIDTMPDGNLERWDVLFEGEDEFEVQRIVSDSVTYLDEEG